MWGFCFSTKGVSVAADSQTEISAGVVDWFQVIKYFMKVRIKHELIILLLAGNPVNLHQKQSVMRSDWEHTCQWPLIMTPEGPVLAFIYLGCFQADVVPPVKMTHGHSCVCFSRFIRRIILHNSDTVPTSTAEAALTKRQKCLEHEQHQQAVLWLWVFLTHWLQSH